MPEEQRAFDPSDPIALQMDGLRGIDTNSLKAFDLATPVAAVLLVRAEHVALARLKKAETEVGALRGELSQLGASKENLRVDLARVQTKGSLVLLEIPLGFLGGFAVNLLTAAPQDHALGAALLGMALLMLGILRASEIAGVWRQLRSSKDRRRSDD